MNYQDLEALAERCRVEAVCLIRPLLPQGNDAEVFVGLILASAAAAQSAAYIKNFMTQGGGPTLEEYVASVLPNSKENS